MLPPAVFGTVLFYVDEETLLQSVPYVARAWRAAADSEALWRRKYVATWRACSMPPSVRRALQTLRTAPTARAPARAVALVRASRGREDHCRCGMCDPHPFCFSTRGDDLPPTAIPAGDDEARPLTWCGWKASFVLRRNVERDLFGAVYRRSRLALGSSDRRSRSRSSRSSDHGTSERRARAAQKHLRRAADTVALVASTLSESPAARPSEAVGALSRTALQRHERAAEHCGVPPGDAMYGIAEELLRTAYCETAAAAAAAAAGGSGSKKASRGEERDHELWELWASTRVNRALALALGAPDAVRDRAMTLARFAAAHALCCGLSRQFRSAEVLLLWAKALYQEASVVLDDERARAEDLLRRAWLLYGAVLEMTPEPESGLYNSMADTAEMLSQTQLSHARIDQWFELALARYVAARTLDPHNGAIVNNFALAFHNHAFLKTGAPARALLSNAVAFYEEALRFDEDKYIVLYNEGDALTQLSHITPDPAAAERHFRRAIARYEESCRINANYHSSFNNWGWAWLERANRCAAHADAERYLERASACFARALQLRPGYHISISNCGNVALERACRYNRPADWDDALAHYRRALAIKPGFVKALHYIGLLHMERARRLPADSNSDSSDSNRNSNDELRTQWLRACTTACTKALAIKPCYPLCAFTCAQASVLLGDRATAARMVGIYNTITGSVADAADGALPLTLAVFDEHNSDLAFNFKSYPWKCG